MSPGSCAQDFEDDVVEIRRTDDEPTEGPARVRPRVGWFPTTRSIHIPHPPKSAATLKRRAKNKAARAARKKSRK